MLQFPNGTSKTPKRLPSSVWWMWQIIALVALLVPIQLSATQSAISTGVYGDWLIGYDSATHTVTGYLGSRSASSKDLACAFYFVGNLSKSPARIRVFDPAKPEATQDGTLTTHLPGAITIELKLGPRPCATMPQAIDLSITRSYQWKEVRVTKTPDAPLFDLPDSNSASHRKLGTGDAVGVEESAPGWLKVGYVTKAGGASGWAREENFCPVQNQHKGAAGSVVHSNVQ